MQNGQSYFGDVLFKLSEMGRKQEIVVDENFKAQLKEELKNQPTEDPVIERIEPDFPEPHPAKEVGREDNQIQRLMKKWQALLIGLPALLVTFLVIFALKGMFFGESGPKTDFEKRFNVSYKGPFSTEEREDEFQKVIAKITSRRNSEKVRVVRKNSDRVLVDVKIIDDGREEFLIQKERGNWYGRVYELIK
jgi:hypothetical protein